MLVDSISNGVDMLLAVDSLNDVALMRDKPTKGFANNF